MRTSLLRSLAGILYRTSCASPFTGLASRREFRLLPFVRFADDAWRSSKITVAALTTSKPPTFSLRTSDSASAPKGYLLPYCYSSTLAKYAARRAASPGAYGCTCLLRIEGFASCCGSGS